MSITKLNPKSMPDAGAMGYSQITISDPGKLVFISGQVAWSRDNTLVPADLGEQAKLAIGNVGIALSELGASSENVTSVRLYVVNMNPEKLAQVAGTLAEFFGGQAPSVTGIGVTSLASPDLFVEVEVTAVI